MSNFIKKLLNKLNEKSYKQINLIKIIKNIFWHVGDKLIRIFIGLIVTSLLARYLGPDKFGILNFCLAFIIIFAMISSLGLQTIVTKEIVNNTNDANKIIGTNFFLQFFLSFICIILAIILIHLLKPDDKVIKLFLSILSLNLIFRSAECIKYWFDSQVSSKYYLWVETSNYIFFSFLKILFIFINASLISFIWLFVLEAAVTFLGLFLVYIIKGGRPKLWFFNFNLAKHLLKRSWPILLSTVAINIYMRIDQVMLGQLAGNEAVGIYSVAVRITESFYFIPYAIIISSFPDILHAQRDNLQLYYVKFQTLFEVILISSFIIILTVLFFSDWLILNLFGEVYFFASSIIKIHIWILLFGFIAIINTQWFVIENLQKLNFYIVLFGLSTNIILNYFLIKSHGMQGAAFATLFSIILQTIIFNLFFKRTRKIFFTLTKSLLFKNITNFFSLNKN